MPPGSIGELKYSAQSHHLANVSITRTRITGLMALKLLENGMPFKVRTNLKGFKKYVTKRGLIQNKGVYLDMSNDNPLEDIFGLGDHTLLSAKNSLNEPLSSRSFVNYWIAAPQASTDFWAMAGWDGDDFIQGTDAAENEIHGFGGDDYLHGSANHNDNLLGGDGNDKIYSYKGDDLLFGDDGSDVLSGGQGDDSLSGGDGKDSLYGAKGDDTLIGGDGDDLLMGGPGINNLSGGRGADRFGLLKDADHNIIDFDPSEGDRLLMRSKDMANLRILPKGSGFILDLGKRGNTTISMEGTAITADDIVDAIILRR